MANPRNLRAKRTAERPRCETCGKAAWVIDLYCRVSEDYDGDGGLRSVDDQELDGREFVEDDLPCCYRVGEVFKDPDLSGWQPRVIRPDFIRCMERLTAGTSNGLWVYDISRFTRKPKEGEPLIDAADSGAAFFSSNRRWNMHDPQDRKSFRDALASAEHESMVLKKRITRGKKLKAVRRGVPNTSTRPFGRAGLERPPSKDERRRMAEAGDPYEPRNVPDAVWQAEMEGIRDAVSMIELGESFSAAMRMLNDRGLRTYYGNPWCLASFLEMLRRPSLAGYVTYGDKQIVPDKFLPKPWALEPERWAALQVTLSNPVRKRPTSPDGYQGMLTGVAHCEVCGRPVRCVPSRRDARPGWARRYTYRCSGDNVFGVYVCGKVDMSVVTADEVVEAAMLRRLADARHREEMARLNAEATDERAIIENEIANAEKSVLEMSAKLGAGRTTQARYDAFEEQSDRKIAELQAKLARCVVPPPPAAKTAEEALEMWHATAEDITARREMIRQAFPKLTIRRAMTRGRNAASPERVDLLGSYFPEVKETGE